MIRTDLMRIIDAFGDPDLSATLRETLKGGTPHGGGGVEAMCYFGDDLEQVLRAVAPVVASLDDMIPGFRDWLETTDYGNDRHMISVLLALAEKLERMPKPSHGELLRRGLETFPVVQRSN